MKRGTRTIRLSTKSGLIPRVNGESRLIPLLCTCALPVYGVKSAHATRTLRRCTVPCLRNRYTRAPFPSSPSSFPLSGDRVAYGTVIVINCNAFVRVPRGTSGGDSPPLQPDRSIASLPRGIQFAEIILFLFEK